MVDMKLDYSLLIDKVDNHYKASSIDKKIVMLCKEAKIKLYRFKRIIENKPKCYFMNDEILRIVRILNIKNNDISNCFLKEI